MEISNFEFIKVLKDDLGHEKYLAEIDVTTGFLFWKKTERVKIFRDLSAWRFLDTGELTPGFVVENMALAKSMKELFGE